MVSLTALRTVILGIEPPFGGGRTFLTEAERLGTALFLTDFTRCLAVPFDAFINSPCLGGMLSKLRSLVKYYRQLINFLPSALLGYLTCLVGAGAAQCQSFSEKIAVRACTPLQSGLFSQEFQDKGEVSAMKRRELLRMSAVLLGTGVSGGLSRALLAGASPVDGASARFEQAQAAAVEFLCDMIIPTTDTPGAVEAGVPDYVATIVFDWYHDDERAAFLRGLAVLDAYCQQQAGNPFHLSSESVRVAALQEQERQARSANQNAADDTPFFNRIKELVVFGYYTSQVGATQELVYRPIPGEYDGDFDYAEIGRQWSY